jgi:peptidoglycan LD-endopeptidase LytH
MQAVPILAILFLAIYAMKRNDILGSNISIWPLDTNVITSIGDTVTHDRDGKGRPHKGLDIFAPAGSLVFSVSDGKVLRVTDGRKSDRESTRAAGLWIDILGDDKVIYRYLHLGQSFVESGQRVKVGTRLGDVAKANTSGLGDKPHLHFEIRESDYTALRQDYGAPINPVALLPSLKAKGTKNESLV